MDTMFKVYLIRKSCFPFINRYHGYDVYGLPYREMKLILEDDNITVTDYDPDYGEQADPSIISKVTGILFHFVN